MQEVKMIDVRKIGLTKSRVHVRFELPIFPTQHHIDSIELAIKHILVDRMVVLSGNISDSEAHKALTARDETIRLMQQRADERDAQYAELKAERDKLQEIIDGVDDALTLMSNASARGKRRHDSLMKRFGKTAI